MSSATEQHGQLDTGYPHALRPELHKALKARGINYWIAQGITFWNRDDGCECLAYGYRPPNGVPKLAIKVVGLTDPEQAIAATLGTGTCHLEEIDKDCDTASEYMLNREWCFDAVYRCSCGCRFGHAAHDRPRYCPNCGARVVEADE